jgi:hypothetical protein
MHLSGWRWGPAAGSFELGNEPDCSISGDEFPD